MEILLTFTLADSLGADNSLFSITNEGLLSFNDVPNFENPADTDGNNIYQLGVQVSDGEESVIQLINVTVTNENETSINRAPVFTSDNSLSVNENLKLVTTVTAEDIDRDNLTFSLVSNIGSDNSLFSITNEGELSFNDAPDFEEPIDSDLNNIYSVGIEVSDGEISTTQLLQITVVDVADSIFDGINVEEPSIISTPTQIEEPTIDIDEGNTIPPTNNSELLNDVLIRFQNSKEGAYLFVGEDEASAIRDNFSPPFIEEGQAFKISFEEKDGLVRFNRFRNNFISGTYIFASEQESIGIRANFLDTFTEEGRAFYAYGSDAGVGEDVIRFRNTNNNTYIFALTDEARVIRDNFSNVFVEEGVAFEVSI